jgi:hypothetical protein
LLITVDAYPFFNPPVNVPELYAENVDIRAFRSGFQEWEVFE